MCPYKSREFEIFMPILDAIISVDVKSSVRVVSMENHEIQTTSEKLGSFLVFYRKHIRYTTFLNI